MQKELTCEQVGAIITFYIEGKLSETLQKAVKHHLDICPECSAKFDAIMNMLKRGVQDKISENSDNEAQNKIKNKQYAEFKANLSAYIDNELDDRENIADLTQEALLRIAKNIRNLKNPKNFKSWLNQIVTNLFYDELRKFQRRPEV